MKNEPKRAPADGPAERRWMRRRLAATCCAVLLALPGIAGAASSSPQRGGTLPFAVDAEPPNYDCHANFSFVLMHVVAPHYSTLLKFDTANYPQVVGDLAQSWEVSPDRLTYTERAVP